MQPMKTEVISRFLTLKTHADLALLYNESMEVQVNVEKAHGKQEQVGNLNEKAHRVYTDGMQKWFPFRIPNKANSEPEYTDTPISFSLEQFAQGIGMTGWDWKARKSRWVAFDFDAMVGHSDLHGRKLTDAQLGEIQLLVQDVPFVTVRKSTSGKGLHLYIFLNGVNTDNHTEHSALARSILSMLSGLCGHDFMGKVDICGGNMWVWHKKMYNSDGTQNDGLKLIKLGGKLETVPANWREHMNVASRRSNRSSRKFMETQGITAGSEEDTLFEDLTGKQTQVALDPGHRRLIDWLAANGCVWWWDQDNHMLVTHTFHLKEAHTKLGLCGEFATISTGKDSGADHNCFMFPLRNSGWTVRRYAPGVKEDASWEQDGMGYTRCYYNRNPDFKHLARIAGGVQHEKGGIHFRHAEAAIKVLVALKVAIEIPNFLSSRKCVVKVTKDNKIVIHIDAEGNDDGSKMLGWLHEKKTWCRVINMKLLENSSNESNKNYDNTVRHILANDTDAGWVLKREHGWTEEPLIHVKAALVSLGEDTKEIAQIVGTSVLNAWKLVNKPFQPEYPGNREWNRNAAQFAIAPTLDIQNLSYPSWQLILNHLGQELTEGILANEWCNTNGILTGAEFLMLWIASLIRKPDQPMTYLSLYGSQDSGKSILHEAIAEILITKGVVRADNALQSQQNFNGELENAILCVVEETDLSKNKQAYNRIKDWVTSPYIMIRPLYCQGYMMPNCTHWIQCANEQDSSPVFPGDTRITLINVPSLSEKDKIPKLELKARLRKEAPDFLAALLILDIPASTSRLAIPTIETRAKTHAMNRNMSILEQFIREKAFEVPGHCVSASDFHAQLHLWLEDSERAKWSINKIGRELPDRFPHGRLNFNNQHVHYGNLTFEPDQPPGPRFISVNSYLKHEGTK